MVTSVSSTTTGTTGTGIATSNSSTSSASITSNATNAAKTSAQALITSLGSGSGVDVNSLANNLANAEIAPQKANIQSKIDKSNATISGYSAVKYVLTNLQTAFADLKDQSDFSGITPSNSQPNSYSVSAGANAAAGNHSVIVKSIAQAQRNLSIAFAAPTTQLNQGNAFDLTLTIGNTLKKITIAANQTTPQGVVDAINAAGLSVKANLVNTGSATPYRIVLTGSTGTDQSFSLSSPLKVPAPSVVTTQGSDGTYENSVLTFDNGLSKGQSISVDGLTFTADQDMTATQVAGVFANLSTTSSSLSSPLGKYSGSLSHFNTGSLNGNKLTATSTADGDVTDISVSTSDLFDWPIIQTASNAHLNVDGVDFSSATNSVKEAITGVTLDLFAPSPMDVNQQYIGGNVILSRDPSNAKAKVQNLVNSFNDVISMLGVVSDPKSTVDTYGGTLAGNSIVSSIRSQVRDMVIGYSNSPSGTMTALRDIGVTLDKNGQLQIDSTKLNSALTDHYDDVVKMFSNNQENQTKFNPTSAGIAGEAYKKLDNILDPIGGTLVTLSQDQTAKISDYQKQLDALQTRLQEILKRYTDQFSAMDSLVGQIKSTQAGLTSTFAGMMAAYTKN